MISPAKTSRENRMMNVLRLTNENMTVTDACKKVGVSRSAYYDYLNREPESTQMFQEMLTQSSRVALFETLITRRKLVDKMIRIALADDTKPLELVAIFRETDRYLDKLMRMMRMDGGSNPEAAAEVLSGPVLVPGQSRSTAEYPPHVEKVEK